MSDRSARLDLPFILPAQAQKHVTHNEALQRLDLLVQLVVEATGAETPPASPAEGAAWGLGPAPTGAWAGQGGQLALFAGGGWSFVPPAEGWRAYDRTSGQIMVFSGTAWQPHEAPALNDLDGLGVNAGYDATNRLSVSSPASLFSHEGAGHQVKINKAAATDTGSLLFQTGWSGRAEIGLAGDDTLRLKVSADGVTWAEALAVDPADGTVSGAAVQAAPGDVTPGRLARADYAYGPGNLLGGVSLAGGVPTGAVLESGSNANGSYVRFADGTQICWAEVSGIDIGSNAGGIYRSGSIIQAYPAAFTAVPAASAAVNSNSAAWINARPVTSSWIGMAFSYAARTGETVSLMAVGRWN